MWQTRPVTQGDVDHLWKALSIAARWDDSISQMKAHPIISRYLAGWGRPFDTGVLAVDDISGFLGACWFRLFEVGEVWGAVEENTPTLSIGVVPSRRRMGVGTRLLDETITLASESGFDRLSLSVSLRNPMAISLYEKHGFTVHGSDGHSQDMVLDI